MRARVTELILFFARPTEWASQDAHREQGKTTKIEQTWQQPIIFLLVAVNCVQREAKDGIGYICIQSRWTIRFCRAVREISRPQPALYGVDFFLSALSGRNHGFLRASQFICACRSFNSETLSPRRFAIRLLIDIFRVVYVHRSFVRQVHAEWAEVGWQKSSGATPAGDFHSCNSSRTARRVQRCGMEKSLKTFCSESLHRWFFQQFAPNSFISPAWIVFRKKLRQ